MNAITSERVAWWFIPLGRNRGKFVLRIGKTELAEVMKDTGKWWTGRVNGREVVSAVTSHDAMRTTEDFLKARRML